MGELPRLELKIQDPSTTIISLIGAFKVENWFFLKHQIAALEINTKKVLLDFKKLISLDTNRATGYGEMWVEGKMIASAELSFVIANASDLPDNKFRMRREEYSMALFRKRK